MPESPLTIAYSPCPNDTFIFFRLAREGDIETVLDDVESLNRMAFEERFDVTKLSFHAWLLLQDRYELLDTGAALGRGCGPLVISKFGTALSPESVVAVPGEYTTAHLLLQLWRPDIRNRVSMTFDKIMDAVDRGEVDAGVIIHEGRFVYRERGLHCIQDLGEWWEAETGHPIPLGCIAAKKSLGAARIASLGQRLKASIEFAFADPDATSDYVRTHAQELSDEVTREHIRTYVNDFTLDLGGEGHAAIDKLQAMAKEAGIIR
jgi:1,4-dihydroxy-6-naphthoate synthase